MNVYVIADLHLSSDNPRLIDAFESFSEQISNGDELYILGDLFNYYVGVDPANEAQAAVRRVNSSVESRGGRVFFIHGNRDFLLNRYDAHYFKVKLLDDIAVAKVLGTDILLLHGDELCDENLLYFVFRKISRCFLLQRIFNFLTSFDYRTRIARRMRNKSMQNFAAGNYVKRMINNESARALMNRYGVKILIHGHTHTVGETVIDGCGRVIDTGDWNSDSFTYIKISDDNSGKPGLEIIQKKLS